MTTREILSITDDPFAEGGTLPDTLPDHPWDLFSDWWTEAHTGGPEGRPVQPNPNAMSIATIGADALPASRIVLCKHFETDASGGTGRIVFYTNYEGRKGRDLTANPVASVCFHWDALDRQVRIEGPVTRSTPEESDAYYNSRSLEKRLGAWASHQSQPIKSRDALLQQYADVLERFNVPLEAISGERDAPDVRIPRPAHWGGFRVWARRVELWIGGKGRFHDRAEWTRTLTPSGETFTGGKWSSTRLQP